MFYNKGRDHVATVINLTDIIVEYYWERVDGTNLKGFMSSRSGNCKVSITKFKYFIETNSFKELSTLEMELL